MLDSHAVLGPEPFNRKDHSSRNGMVTVACHFVLSVDSAYSSFPGGIVFSAKWTRAVFTLELLIGVCVKQRFEV